MCYPQFNYHITDTVFQNQGTNIELHQKQKNHTLPKSHCYPFWSKLAWLLGICHASVDTFTRLWQDVFFKSHLVQKNPYCFSDINRLALSSKAVSRGLIEFTNPSGSSNLTFILRGEKGYFQTKLTSEYLSTELQQWDDLLNHQHSYWTDISISEDHLIFRYISPQKNTCKCKHSSHSISKIYPESQYNRPILVGRLKDSKWQSEIVVVKRGARTECS